MIKVYPNEQQEGSAAVAFIDADGDLVLRSHSRNSLGQEYCMVVDAVEGSVLDMPSMSFNDALDRWSPQHVFYRGERFALSMLFV